MNLASELIAANERPPELSDDLAMLFGLMPPHPKPNTRPLVPHHLFGLGVHGGGSVAKRREARERRMNAEVEYLRANAGMTAAELADAFGVSSECMTSDLRLLEAGNRTRRSGSRLPFRWSAV